MNTPGDCSAWDLLRIYVDRGTSALICINAFVLKLVERDVCINRRA